MRNAPPCWNRKDRIINSSNNSAATCSRKRTRCKKGTVWYIEAMEDGADGTGAKNKAKIEISGVKERFVVLEGSCTV